METSRLDGARESQNPRNTRNRRAGAMGVERQWPTRVAALERVAALCASAPKQTAACLPTLVPELTPSLWDTKKEVKAAVLTQREK